MATLDRLAPPPPVVLPREGTWSPRRAIAAALTVAVAIALIQVFQSGTFANTGASIQRLERERLDARARIHSLEAEIAALASLERTERAARDRLGMVAPREIVYIEVSVPAPSGPLLPRPVVDEDTAPGDNRSWWERFLQAFPFR